jgi:hypothetical protein
MMGNYQWISVSTFGAIILFIACGQPERKVASPDSSNSSIPLDTAKENTIKKSSGTDTSFPPPPPPPKKIISFGDPEIAGNVFYNLPYCSGARPTDEILAQLAIWKPLINSTLEFRNNSVGYLIQTDNSGGFSEIVPEGDYDVYLTRKTDKRNYDVSPGKCEDCLSLPVAKVKLIVYGNNDIHFTFRCGPEDKIKP